MTSVRQQVSSYSKHNGGVDRPVQQSSRANYCVVNGPPLAQCNVMPVRVIGLHLAALKKNNFTAAPDIRDNTARVHL